MPYPTGKLLHLREYSPFIGKWLANYIAVAIRFASIPMPLYVAIFQYACKLIAD